VPGFRLILAPSELRGSTRAAGVGVQFDFAAHLFPELPGEVSVRVLSHGKPGQQVAHGVITRRFSRTPVEASRLVFHFLGEFAHGVEAKGSVKPDWTARHKARTNR
jgi:hypothetical protein